MGAGQLEAHLHGQPGGVEAEVRPQAIGAGQRLAGVVAPRFAESDPCAGHERDRAGG